MSAVVGGMLCKSGKPSIIIIIIYKVLKFAFEANITKFNPDNAYFSKHMLDAICTFTFDEGSVKVTSLLLLLLLLRFS